MPIVIQKDLPAFDILTKENIFVMPTNRAITQDIRPLEIAIVNLMPTKIETETQLLRLLGNTPLQVNVTLINTASYKSRHVSENHMEGGAAAYILKARMQYMRDMGADAESVQRVADQHRNGNAPPEDGTHERQRSGACRNA